MYKRYIAILFRPKWQERTWRRNYDFPTCKYELSIYRAFWFSHLWDSFLLDTALEGSSLYRK